MDSIDKKLDRIENGIVKILNNLPSSNNLLKKQLLPSQNQQKLSIITICYNEKNICETCESILAQEYTDFQWIVIDGGSDEKYLKELKKYKNRMDFYISEPDNGRYHAMNKGILQANGEWVLFLNGGDSLYNKETLKNIFNFKKHPILKSPNFDVDILYGEVISKENGMMPWPSWGVGPQIWDMNRFEHYSLPHQATFIKRYMFNKCGLYDEKYKSAGDLEWFIRSIIENNATYGYIPTIISIYNFDGISSTNKIAIEESISIRKKYNKYIKNVNHDIVNYAYKLLLFREPESEKIIQNAINLDRTDFILQILQSDEFKKKNSVLYKQLYKNNM